MLSYVVRRLLHSVVVLLAASFLVFTFVSASGDPLAQLRITPNLSEESVQNVVERKHLDDPIPVRYLYWLRDAVTNQFGTTLLGDRPILPDLWRVMKNTLQLVIVAECLAILVAVGIGSLILTFRGLFMPDMLYGVVVLVVIEALILVSIVRVVERRVAPWSRDVQLRE